jgi:hypothetical protein
MFLIEAEEVGMVMMECLPMAIKCPLISMNLE